MELILSSEAFVTTYKPTKRQNPEDHNQRKAISFKMITQAMWSCPVKDSNVEIYIYIYIYIYLLNYDRPMHDLMFPSRLNTKKSSVATVRVRMEVVVVIYLTTLFQHLRLYSVDF
jgi:hypothetical protein